MALQKHAAYSLCEERPELLGDNSPSPPRMKSFLAFGVFAVFHFLLFGALSLWMISSFITPKLKRKTCDFEPNICFLAPLPRECNGAPQ
jgi:hypothetical protein